MKRLAEINLPDLNEYRQAFVQQQVIIPLPTVPFLPTGLLKELPPPPAGKAGWPWTVETPPQTELVNRSKISIVTPSYNQGQFIEETIRSVLLQNYPNLEFIIIDGGSTDGTKEILEKYSPWLSFWQSEKDRGQGHAINLGFSLASGDYYGWINSDDFYLPYCLDRIKNAFVSSNKDFVYGDSIEINQVTGQSNYWQGYFILDRHLAIGGIIASHAAFWRNTIHAPIWEEINCAIDYELWRRMVTGKSKFHLREPLAICRIHDSSKSYMSSYKSKWEEDNKKIFSSYGTNRFKLKFLNLELNMLHNAYKTLNRNDTWKISQAELSLFKFSQ